MCKMMAVSSYSLLEHEDLGKNIINRALIVNNKYRSR